jgi:ubiquinone/menaquinone biosynthesis C-methylase UbiE
MTVLDLGCGPGYFTVEIARILSGSGKVIAADLQDGMLVKVMRKIKGTALEKVVDLHKCQENSIGITEKVDFILAFWMVHEVPDHERLFRELKSILKPDGKLFIIEPRMHVAQKAFKKMTGICLDAGFKIETRPKVFFSRTLLLAHESDK